MVRCIGVVFHTRPGWRISFVIPRSLLFRASLNRGSTVLKTNSFSLLHNCKASRDSLETLFIGSGYPPCALASLPVSHAIRVLALASFLHGRSPLDLVTSFQHSLTVTAKTHADLAHAVLAVKPPDSRALFACDLRPLRSPLAPARPKPPV